MAGYRATPVLPKLKQSQRAKKLIRDFERAKRALEVYIYNLEMANGSHSVPKTA